MTCFLASILNASFKEGLGGVNRVRGGELVLYYTLKIIINGNTEDLLNCFCKKWSYGANYNQARNYKGQELSEE